MKIVHLTTHIKGGAGNFAENVFKAGLKINNHQNYLFSVDSLKLNFFFRLYSSLLNRVYDKIYFLASSLKILKYHHFFFGLYPSAIFKGKIKKKLINVDVFFVYWISKFLDNQDLIYLKKMNPKAKFIFLSTDEAHFTGGCHYTFDCKEYKNLCTNCPGVNLLFLQKKIHEEFNSKIKLHEKLNSLFVLPSSTLKKDFKNSFIINNYKNKVIPFGAYFEDELNSFLHNRKNYLSNSNNTFNILVRSSSEPRKGCQLFINSMKHLLASNFMRLDSFQLNIIGDNYLLDNGISKMINTKFHGIVKRNRLLELYAESDVFIVTSEEDSGPIMINECSGLGVYILSTDVGVAYDLINDDNGKIYDRNSGSLAESIKSLNIKNIRNFSKSHLESDDFNNLTFEKFYWKIINEIN